MAGWWGCSIGRTPSAWPVCGHKPLGLTQLNGSVFWRGCLPTRSSISSGRLFRPFIAAHAHARRVHYRKQHLRLFTIVVLGVKLAIEGVLPFIHAKGADPVGILAADLTLPYWSLVKAQKA